MLAPNTDKAQARKKPAEQVITQLQKWADMANVAVEMDDTDLDRLGQEVRRSFEMDKTSRSDWESDVEKAMERAKQEPPPKKNYPFEGASNIQYPLLLTATIQFAARAYDAMVPGRDVVKAKVIGKDPEGQKAERARRISHHMSYQLLDQMPDWEEDTDTLVHQIPIVGCSFRKLWHDTTVKRTFSEMVSAMDFVVHQRTKNLASVPRATHIFEAYPHEVEEFVMADLWLDQDLGMPITTEADEDAPHEFLEQHCMMDMDGDGLQEPWCVVVHRDTGKVVRVFANYDPADVVVRETKQGAQRVAKVPRKSHFIKYPFLRDPEGGFYDIGFGKLLGNLSDAIDSTLNQLFDAGHLQNAGGGFIGAGLRMKKTTFRFSPGVYHTVQAAGTKVREAIYNMEHPGPSPVLFQLLGLLVDAAREVASVKDVLTGDIQRTMTATTTLALIEQGMKAYTAIYKRLYRAMKHEFKLLYEINAKHLDEQVYFQVMDDEMAVKREDYDTQDYDICPIADPKMVTDMQRLARAQIVFETAQHPLWQTYHKPRESLARFYESVGIEEMDDIIKDEEQLQAEQQPDPEVLDMQKRDAEAEIMGKEKKGMRDEAAAIKDISDAEGARRKRDAEAYGEEFAADFAQVQGQLEAAE